MSTEILNQTIEILRAEKIALEQTLFETIRASNTHRANVILVSNSNQVLTKQLAEANQKIADLSVKKEDDVMIDAA